MTKSIIIHIIDTGGIEGVVAQWCDPLTSQPEQSGGVGSIPGRDPPFERNDKRGRGLD